MAPRKAIESLAAAPESMLTSWGKRITHLMDRTDPTVKSGQDLVLNVVLFGAAIFLINKYGHKLAV